MKKSVYLFGFVGAIIYSCSTKTVAASASSIDMNAEIVSKGKTVFDSSCGKCHGLPEAADHTADQWAKIIAHMSPKAKLTEEETNWVLAYVKTNAKKN